MYRNSLELSVSSIYPYTLRVFRKAYGGSVRTSDRGGTRRRCSEWRIYGDAAAEVLEDVVEHLREKKAQALVCLALRHLPAGPGREGLVEQLKYLKRLEYPGDAEEEEEEHAAD